MEEPNNNLPENPTFVEGVIEEVFDANLLSNYDKTIEYMEAIEGKGWLKHQPKGVNIKNTLEHVMDWLGGNKENSESHRNTVVLYGFAGGHRYLIERDGSVKFMTGFATSRTEPLAKILKFPMIK